MVDHMLQSFRFVRCCYDHFDVPSHHSLHALRSSAWFRGIWFQSYKVKNNRQKFNADYIFLGFCYWSHVPGLGHVTADKQMPSALDYLGHFKEALEIERRLARPGVSKALKDVLNVLVATYNKMATNKRHRVDANRKSVTYNMFLIPKISFTWNFLVAGPGWKLDVLYFQHPLAIWGPENDKAAFICAHFSHQAEVAKAPGSRRIALASSQALRSIPTRTLRPILISIIISWDLRVIWKLCPRAWFTKADFSPISTPCMRPAAGYSPKWLVGARQHESHGTTEIRWEASVEGNPDLHFGYMPFVGHQGNTGLPSSWWTINIK